MRSDNRRPLLRMFFGVLAVAGIVFLFRGAAERGFTFFERPFAAIGTWIHQQARGLTDADRLAKERVSFAVDFAEINRLREENLDLRKRLSFADQRGFRVVSGHIIARTASEETRSFLIDRGSGDGLRIGQPAMIDDGVFVGKIISVTEKTATVGSLTDPAISTAAAVVNKDRTIGITRGLSGRLIRLQFVPHDESLNVNDLIVTSGLETGVPSGLLIGSINSVVSDKAEPFQGAIVEPFADMRHRDSVTIIVGYAI